MDSNHIDRSLAPAVSPLPSLQLPQWTVTRLQCGARLVTLREYSCDSPVFQLKLLVAGAGLYDRPGSAVPRLTTLVIDQGAGGRDAASLAELIEGNGAWLGNKIHSRYCEISVRGLNETAPDIVPAFINMAGSPAFEADRVEAIAEMKAQAEAVKISKPVNVAAREMNRRLLGDAHPGAVFLQPDDYRGVRRDSLAAFHSATFMPRNMTFFLSGHIDDGLESLVTGCIENALGCLPSSGGEGTAVAVPVTSAGRYDLEVEGNRQAAIAVGIPAISQSHPDYAMLRVAVTGLGGYFGSRLVSNLREERGLTYGIGASMASERDGSRVKIATECRLENADEALGEIRRELLRFIDEPPHGEELKRLTGFMQTGMTSTLDSPFSVLDCAVRAETAGASPDFMDRLWRATEQAMPDELARVVAEHLTVPAVEVVVR